MKNLITLYFIIFCTFFTISAQDKTNDTTGKVKELPPKGSAPKDFKLPEKKVTTLKNGLTLVMIPYGKVPKAEINIMVKTGNLHETNDETWLSDLVADLMEEGSTKNNTKEIAKKMAAMGGDLKVNVTPHATNFRASVLREFAPSAINLMAEVVMNPAFPEKELERLKSDMKRNISIYMTEADSQAEKEFYGELYPNVTHGNIYSTPEKVDSFNLEKIKEFYNKQFGAKRTTVYVAGNFDEDQVTEVVKSVFKNWKEGPEDSYPSISAVSKGNTKIIDRPNAPQSTIYYGLPVADPSNTDYVALNVTNSLLGGSFGSRITSNIREDKGYTYSPRSSLKNYYKSSIWLESADVTTKHTGESLSEIKKEIEILQKTPPTEEELKGIQNYEAGIFILRNSSPSGIINQLSYLNVFDLPESNLTNRIKNIYAVTPEKVQEITKKYISPEKMTLIVVGDKKVIEDQVNTFNKKSEPVKE